MKKPIKKYWRDICRAITNGETKGEVAKQFGVKREDIISEEYERKRIEQLRINAWQHRPN